MITKLALALALTLVAAVQSDFTKHAEDHNIDTAYKYKPIVHHHPGFKHMEKVQGKNHSLILGKRRDGDSLIHFRVVKRSAVKFWIVETDIWFPSMGEKNNKTINCLQVLDRKANGYGGWAYVMKGGIGAKNVSLHFMSERSHGFNFLVHVYGYNN
nr:PREDICTED: probable salivary secreted peptide [Bemisia tabaci]XP_018897691.1 PREDICTED: probable salivary secreted peptide [Bemisia tabaci]XP_018897692.1 PREDICTED: probable salivary secreted peptide [Bemisia tabaci]XP_018897693.1 PREDICTED: probable salivary secreted peptide [Bemisia tabaci]